MLRLSYTIFDTELGWVGIMGSGKGVCRIMWHQPSSEAALAELSPLSAAENSHPFGDLPLRIQRYFEGKRVAFPNRLDLSTATPFQGAVLKLVRSIPYGETRSYASVAQRLGKPKAFRAVGQALARNPIPIIIPCHRVVGSDGGLVGFGSGLGLKSHLLTLEALPSSSSPATPV